MPLVNNSSGPIYSFENDVSGRLFCWLIESGQVDFQAMIERAVQGEPDPHSWVKRLADALEAKVGQNWAMRRRSLRRPGLPKTPFRAQGSRLQHLVPTEPLEEDQVQGGRPRAAGLYGADATGDR